ncbi:copper resistance CopC family protein [Microbacterium sp. CH12i]|uniref:copper resistance CopC family protein n=1 Tax=Microbacterium sp. CH12i TaxID=1479651 RepID=UPI00068CFE83|nr:copper resistance CopC family protein [Microbacterium sp. CH12i]
MTTRKAPWFAGAIMAFVAAATFGTAAPAAYAHDNLLESSPAAEETVTQVDEVLLTFSGELVDFSQSSFAQIQGPDGLFYESSCSTIDLNVLSTPVQLGEPGVYSVVWNAVSSDGHPISEGYEFTYAPADDAEPGLGWDLPACGNEDTRVQPGALPAEPSPDADQTVTPEATPSTAPQQQDEAAGIVVPLIITAVIVGGGIIVISLIVSRVRKRRADK